MIGIFSRWETALLDELHFFGTGNPYVNAIFGAPKGITLFEILKMLSVDPGMLSLDICKITGENDAKMEDVKNLVAK